MKLPAFRRATKGLAGMKLNDQPVLITGGAGFIGTNLAARVLQRGGQVMIFDNLSHAGVERNLDWLLAQNKALGEDRLQFVEGDVTDFASVQSVVEHAGAVFHLAAQVSVPTSLADPLDDFEVNARGTLHVVEAIRQRRDKEGVAVPMVFASTNKVYGALDGLDVALVGNRYSPSESSFAVMGISESWPLDFISPFGCSKGAADQYVRDYARNYDLPFVVFRMSTIYGPHQFGNENQGWVTHFLLKAMCGEQIIVYGDGRQVRDILWVGDLVDAFEQTLRYIPRLGGRTFNIGGGLRNAVSVLDVLEYIHDNGVNKPQLQLGDWRTGEQKYYVSDIRAFREATGWKPQVGTRDGIAKLAQWLQEHSDMYETRTVKKFSLSSRSPMTLVA